VSDAKLLAFPVRSNIAPFVMVTSPAVLKRFQNDLLMAGFSDEITLPILENENDAVMLNWQKTHGKILLEDAVVVDVTVTVDIPFLTQHFKDIEHLLLVSDTLFDHIVTNCT